MKKNRAIIAIILLLVITGVAAVVHFNTRRVIPEEAIEVCHEEETFVVDITKLLYNQVSGTRVNGKGEEKQIDASGILLKTILEDLEITEYKSVCVVADDAYSAELTAEEKNKRIEELKKATADFMKAVEKERSSKK